MAKSGMKLTKRPPPASKQFEVWRTETKRQLQPVADQRADEYSGAVSSFQSQHKPDFEGQVAVGPKRIFLRVIIRNGSDVINKYGLTVRGLWNIWNKGTKAHVIVPRFSTILAFAVDGAVAFARKVKHPGTRGSGAKLKIDKRLRPGEIKEVRRAGQKAWKKVQQFNRR